MEKLVTSDYLSRKAGYVDQLLKYDQKDDLKLKNKQKKLNLFSYHDYEMIEM